MAVADDGHFGRAARGPYTLPGSRSISGARQVQAWRGSPVLNLEQVYGAITYHLAHRAEIDTYLREGELEAERLREGTRRSDPAFYQKLASARQRQP